MTNDSSSEYLRNAVMTASPEQLHLMLYDGAIRFASQARDAMGRCDFETSCEKLIRSQNIVIEMRNGLRAEIAPEICSQMSALYTFIYNRLVEANMKRSQGAIDDAIRILQHQRETWQMLIEKARHERGGELAAPSRDRGAEKRPSNDAAAGLTICVEG